MATYNKRGGKRYNSRKRISNKETIESTTAEVFETLDTGASKSEQFVSKYQIPIISGVVLITISVFVYLAYDSFILNPKKEDAVTELNQAQYYFNLALNTEDSKDLFKNAINGAGGKFGFLDIIENQMNGLVFKVNDVKSLAEKLIFSVNNSEKMNSYAKNNFEKIKNQYDWTKIGKLNKDAYLYCK